ncbi:MAG: T9SS type A sorting domain-containing protein [Bacteroidota bacterium]|nr:T9SS type A sorting domain-containing protein [Bacteroidota bacterium]
MIFSSYYYPENAEGITEINYIFFNEADPLDSVYINVKYKTSTEGVEKDFYENKISNAYPNPANAEVSFDLNLEMVQADVQLIISNILGATVKSVNVSGKSGRIKINTSDLESGLYMYSIMIDQKIIKSDKLIISH